jgi:hypothetical protein
MIVMMATFHLLVTVTCFGDNPSPSFIKVNIQFADNSIKSIYLEGEKTDYLTDTPRIDYATEENAAQRVLFFASWYMFYFDSYADTIYAIKQDSIEPFYFAIKNRINLINGSFSIGKKKIKKDQNWCNGIGPTDSISQNAISSWWNFRWLDAKQFDVVRNHTIIFSAVHSEDEPNQNPLQFRVISFNPSITEKQFNFWYKKYGLKNKYIANAQKSGELVIIHQPTD